MKIAKWGWLLLVAFLALTVVGCGGGSDYDDELPEEARTIVQIFLGSWEGQDANLMIDGGNTFAYPFTGYIYGYINDATEYTDQAALEAAGGFLEALDAFFDDRVAENVVLDYTAETQDNTATANGNFTAYLTSSTVGGSFKFYFIKEGETWRMNRFSIWPGGSGDIEDR